MLPSGTPALLLVDIQQGLDDEAYYGGNRNNPDAESKAAEILATWRKLSWPIYHIQHSSLNPESRLHASRPGFKIKKEVLPLDAEMVIVKHRNSAFIGTNLEVQLRSKNFNHLVIIGLTTNHCVSSTARMAANLGFKVTIISDATATFDRKGINGQHFDSETVHQVELASLQNEFAEIINTQTLLEKI